MDYLYYYYVFLMYLTFLTKLFNANPLLGENVKPAKKGECPFIVSISAECPVVVKDYHFCGGALISKTHVITSAHCVEYMHKLCSTIIVITIDFDSGRIHKLKSWITYDEWAQVNNVIPEYSENDLAIVTLLEDVNDIVPGVISNLTSSKVLGRKVVTAGWGCIDEPKYLKPKYLQKAYLNVFTREEVSHYQKVAVDSNMTVPLNVYYTSADPLAVTSCGDSGSPLLLASNKEIVGNNDSRWDVQEAGQNPTAMSLHVIVDYYRDFIESFINNV